MIVNKNREKEDRYEADMLSMKTEFSTLFYELGTLRAKTVVSSDYDAKLRIK